MSKKQREASMNAIEKIEAMRKAGWGVFVYCHPVANDDPEAEKFVGQIRATGKAYEAKGPDIEQVIDLLYRGARVVARRN